MNFIGKDGEIKPDISWFALLYIGSMYNIPVCIYLRKDHPYYPPYCFVVPTAGMSLSPSRYMDARGMVYLPYLNEWKQVSCVIKAMCEVVSYLYRTSLIYLILFKY